MTKNDSIDAAKVQQLYSETHADYTSLFGCHRSGDTHSFRRRLEIVSQLAPRRIDHLFDCAIGTGEVTEALLKTSCVSTALLNDFSPSMLEHAKSRLADAECGALGTAVKFCEGDVFDVLASEESTFDAVLCLGLIAHTGRLRELLGLIRHRLEVGGVLILQATIADQPFVALHRALTQERYFRNHGYRIAYFRKRELVESVESSGFRIAEQRRFCIRIPFADKLWPSGNYYFEEACTGVARRVGSECIFKLVAE